MRTSETPILIRPGHRAICALLVAVAIVPTYANAFDLRPLRMPSLHLRRHKDCTTVARLDWRTSYADACREARQQRRMLVINFVPAGDDDTQRSFEQYVDCSAALRTKLRRAVLARIPVDARLDIGDDPQPLIDDPVFKHLGRSPGLVILDFQHPGKRYYGRVVTALPFTSGKYYRWENSHLAIALDLPPGTITQRTMVWAVRTHPEAPQSTVGRQSPALAAAAAKQSAYQAKIGVQGHHHWETRFVQVREATDADSASEVVAESWENQDLIDSCIDCVKSWRYSPGHWSAVRTRHRLFGYDIRRGRNGIWYGTGIFAN